MSSSEIHFNAPLIKYRKLTVLISVLLTSFSLIDVKMTEFRKCVFLDRDGVLNKELGYQITKIEEFELVGGIKEQLARFRDSGFMLIIITNQSGIAKGSYGEEFVYECFDKIQQATGHVIDDMYFAPGHDSLSKSLSRKPDSLMFERAIAKHKVDATHSYMIGDKERDLIPAKKFGIGTILISKQSTSEYADYGVESLSAAADIILKDD